MQFNARATSETISRVYKQADEMKVTLGEWMERAANALERVGDTARILVRTMGEAASKLDPLAASYLISVTYTAMLPDEMRSRLGAYYTPRDSLLAHEPDERSEYFDLVIGNPPHGRISLAAEVQERFKRSLYGHANLYGVFTDLAIQFAKTGGVIAYVTPTSFLAGEYFKALRSLLASSARPVNIGFVSVRKGVFDDALQETILSFPLNSRRVKSAVSRLFDVLRHCRREFRQFRDGD